MAAKELKEFTFVNGKLYFRGSGGILAHDMSKAYAGKELQRVHYLSYGDNYVSLCRCFQRQGYYWLEIAKGSC